MKQFDLTEEVGNYKLNKEKTMSKFFTISWTEIVGALVSAILVAILAMIAYIVSVGDIFLVSGKTIANIGVMSIFTGLASIIKNILTTSRGDFLGAVKVKETQ